MIFLSNVITKLTENVTAKSMYQCMCYMMSMDIDICSWTSFSMTENLKRESVWMIKEILWKVSSASGGQLLAGIYAANGMITWQLGKSYECWISHTPSKGPNMTWQKKFTTSFQLVNRTHSQEERQDCRTYQVEIDQVFEKDPYIWYWTPQDGKAYDFDKNH